jgi:hypothetical protein
MFCMEKNSSRGKQTIIVVHGTFSGPKSDLQQWWQRDASLVHAAYYMDDACIERIAEWIAGHATKRL